MRDWADLSFTNPLLRLRSVRFCSRRYPFLIFDEQRQQSKGKISFQRLVKRATLAAEHQK